MTIFSGFAISEDNGETFHRASNVPAMERTHNETLFRVVHTALYDDGKWKMYYGERIISLIWICHKRDGVE